MARKADIPQRVTTLALHLGGYIVRDHRTLESTDWHIFNYQREHLMTVSKLVEGDKWRLSRPGYPPIFGPSVVDVYKEYRSQATTADTDA